MALQENRLSAVLIRKCNVALGRNVLVWSERQSYIRKVYSEWERFIGNGNTEGLTVRQEILESWERSYRYGVPPAQWGAPVVLNDEQMRQELISNQDMLEAASPLVKELGQLLDGTGQLLVLCNAEATIIDIVGDHEARFQAADVNLLPGAGIGESVNGTTGAGLVMVNRKPVTILASEHYVTGPKEWACAAAPILRAYDMVGILCLTGRHTDVNEHSVGLVLSATRAIEGRLVEQYIQRQGALLRAYLQSVLRHRADLIVAIDICGQVADATNRDHLLLVGQSKHCRLIPEAEQIVRRIMANPSLVQTRGQAQIDSIEVPGKGSFTLTCSPVFQGQALCGILLYAYGSNHRPASQGQGGSIQTNKQSPQGGQERSKQVFFRDLVGVSPVFVRTLELAMQAAATDATIVLQGETGVGKEALARAIHRSSERAQGHFIDINCAAIPRDLIASELFGYSPGAFTGASPRGKAGKFEAANRGTLFLDEVGEMSPDAQAYLLRVLQEKEIVRLGSNTTIPVDVRVIAAAHRDLRQLIREGSFREDLYFRLSVIEIAVPPLRERPEDFPHLIAYFLSSFGVNGVMLKEETLRTISRYRWPGNVRELMNVIQKAMVLGWDVEAALLEHVRAQADNIARCNVANDTTITGKAEIEADLIMRTLLSKGGNVTQAAHELGMARSTIYRYLKEKAVRLDRNLKLCN
jgi:transcriptional regulator of acetoin/glycerol metabolism